MAVYLAKVNSDMTDVPEQFVFVEDDVSGAPLRWMTGVMDESEARRQLSSSGTSDAEIDRMIQDARTRLV